MLYLNFAFFDTGGGFLCWGGIKGKRGILRQIQ